MAMSPRQDFVKLIRHNSCELRWEPTLNTRKFRMVVHFDEFTPTLRVDHRIAESNERDYTEFIRLVEKQWEKVGGNAIYIRVSLITMTAQNV